MGDDPQDIGKWTQELTARSLAEQMRALQRYQELAQRVARGELSEQRLREEYLRFAQEESARYARNLAALSLNYYGALIDLSRGYNDRLFDQMLGNAASSDNNSKPPAAPPRRVEMELHAPAGQDAIGAFVIENKRSEPADISFIISEFAGAPGTATFRSPLQIQPARFSIGPFEERVVTLQLPLHAQMFTPGQRYRATVIVRGYDDLELGLTAWADPVADAIESVAQPSAEPATEARPVISAPADSPAARRKPSAPGKGAATAKARNEKPEKNGQPKSAKRSDRRQNTRRKRRDAGRGE